MNKSILIFAFVVIFAVGCAQGDADTRAADATYIAEIEEWRVGRLERLKAVDGYLNLAGLFWLSDLTSSFGSAADNDIVFPPSAAAHIGEFEMTDEGILMTVLSEADVRIDGEPVSAPRSQHGGVALPDVQRAEQRPSGAAPRPERRRGRGKAGRQPDVGGRSPGAAAGREEQDGRHAAGDDEPFDRARPADEHVTEG